MNIKCQRYNHTLSKEWDHFVEGARNGHFMFKRDYIAYHKNRFQDCSLVFYYKSHIVAVLPAHLEQDTLCSHRGLSFGCFITSDKVGINLMLELFASCIAFCKESQIKTWEYKAIPHIYHSVPSEEDLYALHFYNAELILRTPYMCIDFRKIIPFHKCKQMQLRQYKSHYSVKIKETEDFPFFWSRLSHVLNKYHQTTPVHTVDEINYLASYFPKNIRTYIAETEHQGKTVYAGAVLYISKQVVHVQYSFTERESSSLMLAIYDYLIEKYRHSGLCFFSSGISAKEAKVLNNNLIYFKEKIGMRSCLQEIYRLEII